ncbi:ROK family protein [Lacticaseibacillus saniviri]|uniref:fructokinase n=1 Tax=Lacticaseibacillus saniviri JCM 17471 = DSM 24301 TaxID=1293598 RepID=A0A0R2MTA8_9LACO|nr:ROK family protein [Lacticaseibacillus saniviri]KRO16737.1 fructokinase [Lacticaseibacillus saniviri JCM 17471 = DSM 24301]MCG4281573.1 ROK family protein [Lacticaseibacillus saniviri]
MTLYGSIEAGGTKFVLGVGDGSKLVQRYRFDTTTPDAAVSEIVAFFKQYELAGIGIGAFGPVDVNPASPKYGTILNTPKVGWQNFDLLGALKAQLNVPMKITTDVNVACYGEWQEGAAKGKQNVIYLTVGTGIGAGVINQGHFFLGRAHTEVGHIFLQKHPDDHYEGHCPYHGDNCAEGLAAGPAIQGRFPAGAASLAEDDPFWAIEADYIAQLCLDLTLSLAPDVIIVGGGVSKQTQLFPLIRQAFAAKLNGYVDVPALNDYIVPVALGDNSGVTGALLLAEEAAREA